MNNEEKIYEKGLEMGRIHEYGQTMTRLMKEVHKDTKQATYSEAVIVDAAVVMSQFAYLNFAKNGEGFNCEKEVYSLLEAISETTWNIYEVYSACLLEKMKASGGVIKFSEYVEALMNANFKTLFEELDELAERTAVKEG